MWQNIYTDDIANDRYFYRTKVKEKLANGRTNQTVTERPINVNIIRSIGGTMKFTENGNIKHNMTYGFIDINYEVSSDDFIVSEDGKESWRIIYVESYRSEGIKYLTLKREEVDR